MRSAAQEGKLHLQFIFLSSKEIDAYQCMFYQNCTDRCVQGRIQELTRGGAQQAKCSQGVGKIELATLAQLASRLTLLAKAFSFVRTSREKLNSTVIAFSQQQKLPLVPLSQIHDNCFQRHLVRDESDGSFAVDLMFVLGELSIKSCNNNYLAT